MIRKNIGLEIMCCNGGKRNIRNAYQNADNKQKPSTIIRKLSAKSPTPAPVTRQIQVNRPPCPK